MRWMALVPGLLAAACWNQGADLPGEPVGEFEATGLMVEQSCGAAIPAEDPLDLVFDLRAEAGGRAYWRRQGGSTFAGIQQGDEYTFTVSQSWMVIEPDRLRSYVGCSVTQRDTFSFVVAQIDSTQAEQTEQTEQEEESGADAGAVPALLTLSGSQTTEIIPVGGADCTPAIAAAGGPFLSLPCRVEYVLTGSGIAAE